jgi:hypothetical protein
MPILLDDQGTRYQESDSQNIYNALKSGKYQLEPNSTIHVKDSNNETWQLDPTAGDISKQLMATFEAGGRFETKQEAFKRMYPELSGVTGDITAGALSFANTGLLGAPAALLADTKAGEFYKGLADTHPISSTIGDLGGVLTKLTPAGALTSAAGKLAGSVAAPAGKIASLAAEGAATGLVSSVPLGVTEASFGEPGRASEILLGHLGTGALLGAIANPILGVALPKAADLFKKGSEVATDATQSGIGAATKKMTNMTEDQTALFDKLTNDPELRKQALNLTKDVEESTIRSTVDDLQSLSKLIKSDAGKLYDTKFESIVNNLSKSDVQQAQFEMKSLLKQARDAIKENPESYDATYLKALTAAEKTLDVRGAGNIATRKTFEDAMAKVSPELQTEIQKGFDISRAKAIKEARTEIGYSAPFDAAKVGINRTGALANQLYKDMSAVSEKLYGSEFVKISDAYHSAIDTLDNIKKVAFNADGSVNYNKVKSLIGENKASELKLDDLISKVQGLSETMGKQYNFGQRMDETLQNIKSKQLLKTMGGNNVITGMDVVKGSAVTGVAHALGAPIAPLTLGYGLYKTIKNPRSALGLMNMLETAQVKTSNAITAIAKSGKDNSSKIISSYINLKGDYNKNHNDVVKSIQTYQTMSNPQVVQKGMDDTMGILSKIAPNVTGATNAKLMEISQFMQSKAPKTTQDIFTGETKVNATSQKLREYMIYEKAVNDPINALKELNNGVNLSQNREVLQSLYPNIWNQYVQIKLAGTIGKSLSTSERRELNDILGANSEEFSLPAVTNSVLNIQGDNSGMPPQIPKSIPSPSKYSGNTDRLQRLSGK